MKMILERKLPEEDSLMTFSSEKNRVVLTYIISLIICDDFDFFLKICISFEIFSIGIQVTQKT